MVKYSVYYRFIEFLTFFLSKKVCGKDADGGNTQSGCGRTYSWSTVPNLAVDDLPQESSTLNDADILNNNDIHFDVASFHGDSYGRQIALKCCGCKKDIYGARFECMTCYDEKNATKSAGFCLACVLEIVKITTAVDGDKVDGPFTHPGCAAVRSNGIASPSTSTCRACGGLYNTCFGTYGYRSQNSGWNAGECQSEGDVPESPNDQFCSQRCEDSGSTNHQSCLVAHKHHIFDIITPPKTNPAANLLFMGISSSSGDVTVYNLPCVIDEISERKATSKEGDGETVAKYKKDPTRTSFNHVGSVSGCGGNPHGITDTRGSGCCGGGCVACGAGTHWSCCGCSDQSSVHCISISKKQALRNTVFYRSQISAPKSIADISELDYSGVMVSFSTVYNIRIRSFYI